MPAQTVASLFVQRFVIGVGDLAVSNNSQLVLSTYALGSCIAVVAYEPVAKAGGMLHLMLANSRTSPAKAAVQPGMFADTGLPEFFRQLSGLKVDRYRLQILVAGGANVLQGCDPFRIGEQNTLATLSYLEKNGYAVKHKAVGDTINRTLHLELATGLVTLKQRGTEVHISLAD